MFGQRGMKYDSNRCVHLHSDMLNNEKVKEIYFLNLNVELGCDLTGNTGILTLR